MNNQKDILESIYPDLESDEEDGNSQKVEHSEPYKKNKSHQPESGRPTVHAHTVRPLIPLMVGDPGIVPPPPPPISSGAISCSGYGQPVDPYVSNRSGQNFKFGGSRERKNCVYVKNIPQNFNQSEKLATFFRNEGPIKEVRVYQETNSAMVRFIREEHAAKFLNSGKQIFGRSYIVCSLNEKEEVAAQLVKERQNDELRANKKPIEIQTKLMKERIDNVLADKIRALLFLRNNLKAECERQHIASILADTKQLKDELPNYTDEETRKDVSLLINDYDWTLTFPLKTPRNIDKKSLFLEYQKIGPVSSLDFKLLSEEKAEWEDGKNREKAEDRQQRIREYIIKLKFLGVRSCWEMFQKKKDLTMQIEGSSLQQVFSQGRIVRLLALFVGQRIPMTHLSPEFNLIFYSSLFPSLLWIFCLFFLSAPFFFLFHLGFFLLLFYFLIDCLYLGFQLKLLGFGSFD